MSQYIQNISDESVRATNIADWAIAHGIGSLTTAEISHLIGVPVNQVPQRMAPHCKRAEIFSPARGMWVPIPAEYRTWEAPEPSLYIDYMMTFLEVDYCVGWLSAATFHGASHHAAQNFQVATIRQVRDRVFGRSRLQFLTRSYAGMVTVSNQSRARAKVRIASPGTTMLMAASDIDVCGGLDNVANIVIEIAEENPGFVAALVSDAHLFPDAAMRRIGWLLDVFGEGAPNDVERYCASLDSSTSFLSPGGQRLGKLDSKWNLIINQEVEPDI